MPIRKRVFDLFVCLVGLCLWLPALVIAALGIWLFEGRPIVYVSTRRVFRSRSIRLLKFRTMVAGADRIANRDTVPIQGVRFLNIPVDSPLYTRVGRLIERFHFTELLQILHVIMGEMSLVGNRPLPENVIAALRKDFPWAEQRFLTRAGLTGPVQLVGRDALADDERLQLERDYCLACLGAYSIRLDFLTLFYTILIALGLRRPMSYPEVQRLMGRSVGAPGLATARPGGKRRVDPWEVEEPEERVRVQP